MRELRKDPVLNRWVIIATDRSLRPSDYAVQEEDHSQIDPKQDPFAGGNERLTPPEVFAIRPDGSSPNQPGWKVRVIPNKYPALRIEGDIDPRGYGIYDKMNGVGAHEVVVESPDPFIPLHLQPVEHISDVLLTLRTRVEDLSRDKRFAYVLPFKNYGQPAGASLRHSHCQLIATPIVPKRVIESLEGAQEHWKIKRRSIFSDIIDQELLMRERIVYQNEHMLAYCPYASTFPFEIHILPKRFNADFRRADYEELRAMAEALKVCLLKWRGALGHVPYNFLIHTAPNDTPLSGIRDQYPYLDAYFLWHLEMFPRLTSTAGFEWGTGYYINATAPEEAAAFLREIEVEA